MDREIRLADLKDPKADNPLDIDEYIERFSRLFPAMRDAFSKRVCEITSKSYETLHFSELNDNSWIASEKLLNTIKRLLLFELWFLENLVWEQKSIYIVCDNCFTNPLLIWVIKRILWDEYFNKYVEVVNIDYDKEADDELFWKIWDNKLFILWWSLKDTHNIHPSHYTSVLSKLIKSAWTNMHRNNRFVLICFSNQYGAELINIELWDISSPVTITYRWPIECWASVCEIDLEALNTYFEPLSWLTNEWVNWEITAMFTRACYVDFDATWTWKLDVVPLIKDKVTWSIVWWWSLNWNVIWVQFHPEISFFKNKEFLLKSIKEVLLMLEESYDNPSELLSNFDFDEFERYIKRDISEEFYTFVIYFFLKSILDRIIALRLSKTSDTDNEVDYDLSVRNLIENIRSRVWCELLNDRDIFCKENWRRFLLNCDRIWKIIINWILDWIVNRWIKQVSYILWIKNLGSLVIKHKSKVEEKTWKKWIYYFVDLWAWDWTLLKEMYWECRNQDIIFYWVADKIYVEVFPLLRKIWESMWIPLRAIALFLEVFLSNFSSAKWSLYKKIVTSLDSIDLHWIYTLHYRLILNRDKDYISDVKMFSNEWEEEIGLTTMDYIAKNPDFIEKLKKVLVRNLFDFFEWYFERIHLSSFLDFFSQRELWTWIDFLVAIRSTSHVDGREYLKILLDYITDFAKPWSFWIDNWVHQSYTSIPRVMELARLSELSWKSTRVRLIYDETTNYFTWAIIEKAPFLDEDFIVSEFCPWYRVVSVIEASESTFFQLEYFLRNFIAINFKDNDVFKEFNKEIMDVIRIIMNDLLTWDKTRIKQMILNLVNYIASNFKNDNIDYNQIDMATLESYSIWWKTLDDIVWWEIYNPSWINLKANRKY